MMSGGTQRLLTQLQNDAGLGRIGGRVGGKRTSSGDDANRGKMACKSSTHGSQQLDSLSHTHTHNRPTDEAKKQGTIITRKKHATITTRKTTWLVRNAKNLGAVVVEPFQWAAALSVLLGKSTFGNACRYPEVIVGSVLVRGITVTFFAQWRCLPRVVRWYSWVTTTGFFLSPFRPRFEDKPETFIEMRCVVASLVIGLSEACLHYGAKAVAIRAKEIAILLLLFESIVMFAAWLGWFLAD